MPVYKCPNSKYRIGTGPCVFDTKEKAQKSYRAYLFKKHGTKASEMEGIDEPEHIGLMEEAEQVQEIYEADQPGLATQSVLFSKDHYPTLARARAKAKSMGYKTTDVDVGGEKAKYWRFRQKDPGAFVKRTGRPPFVMKDIAPGIRLVLGIPKTQSAKEAEKFDCECLDCGAKIKSEKHCLDTKCPRCGGEMRREQRPGPGR